MPLVKSRSQAMANNILGRSSLAILRAKVPLAVAFDYVSEEATAPENSETGEETGTAATSRRW